MAKEKLKKALGRKDDFHLIDTHRLQPKKDGGTYVPGNVVLSDPVEHMIEHGNYREREEALEILKSLMDDRQQVLKVKLKMENQVMACERRTDRLNDLTIQWLRDQIKSISAELEQREKVIGKHIKEMAKTNRICKALIDLKGCGPITAANILNYIDLEKARHASSVWAYCGYDKPSHERYEKGTAGGGNKTLRSALFVWAGVQIKQGGPYREIYDRVKARLEVSENQTHSRNTEGKMIEAAWKDVKPCHRHGAAIRAMIKNFLADYWFVGRSILGLPTDALYAEAMLGQNHKTVAPEERGWSY
jgi:hypothetical protein